MASNEIKLDEHPQYKKHKDFYQTANDLFEGDQSTLKKPRYLFMHELETRSEGASIRKIREQRSAYINFIEPIVSAWVSLFFSKKPTLDEKTVAVLGDSMENIDGEGTSLFSFIQKKLLPSALVSGLPIVRVNALGEKPKDKADEADGNKYKPYFELIDALSFVDWALEKKDPNRLNKLNFCRIEFDEMTLRTKATDPVMVKRVSVEYRIEDSKVFYIRYEKKEDKQSQHEKEAIWKVISVVELVGWDEIPIVIDLTNESWIKDVMPHCLKYYNLESTLDNICLYQAYQRVLIIGDASSKEVAAVAEHTWSKLPEGTTIEVIEPNNTTTLENRLGVVLNNIFRLAFNQMRMLSADSKVAQAADTIREEKEAINNLIEAESEAIEGIVNQALVMFGKFKGIDDLKPEFKFNLDTTESDMEILIKLYSLFRDEIEQLPTLRKELLNKVSSAFDLEQNEDIQKEIEAYANKPIEVEPELSIKDRVNSGFKGR